MDKEIIRQAIYEAYSEIQKNAFKKIVKEQLLEAINDARWITIHPHGEDSDDYRRLKLKDGETPKEAIKRVYKVGEKETAKINSIKDCFSVDLNKCKRTELEKASTLISRAFVTGQVPIDKRKQYHRKLTEIERAIQRIDTRERADKVGGYTKKLNDLCKFTIFSDLSSESETTQKCVYESFKNVYKKYTVINYGGVRLARIGSRTYAQNVSVRNYITLNSNFYTDLKKIEEDYSHDVSKKWHPIGTNYKSVIAHEFGHALHEYIEKEYGIKPGEIKKQVLEETKINAKEIKDNLSEYATVKPRIGSEFFAEAFSEYVTSENPRPIAMAVGKKIDEILRNKKS